MNARSTRQAGMVLLLSLVFLLLLTMVGLSSMQAAISQEKITASIRHRNQAFQRAESGLRLGEAAVQSPGAGLMPCRSIVTCAPPAEAASVLGPGFNPASAVNWVGMKEGLYGMQNLGPAVGGAHLPPHTQATLYRVTSVGTNGYSRVVLESIYARASEEGGELFRRIMWRQLQ